MVKRDKGYQIFANIIMILLCVLAAVPFVLLFMSSITDEQTLITVLYAYPLSRKQLPGRNFFAFYLFFTMLFSGGLVPS